MRYLNWLLPILILFCVPAAAQRSGLVNSGEVIRQAAALYDSAKYKDGLKLLDKVSRSDTNYVWSLYERSIDCEADSEYTRAIDYCKEGLALKEQRDYEPDFYNTYGNTLTDMGKPDEALKIFDRAIAKYPAYALFYFNKGIAWSALKKPAEAERMFQKTLLVNPYVYSAHFQLGLAALQQGKIVPAYLCFMGYLLVNPEGKYLSRSIKLLDNISKSTDDILEFKSSRAVTPNENYQAVEDILTSKIALDKAYKPKISLDDPISRQIQAVFEKLDYSDTDTDFYIQYYLPFYKQLYAENKLEPFIFRIFSSVNIPLIQEYTKKNKKELEACSAEAGVYFDLVRQTRELFYKKRAGYTEKYLFEDGKLAGKGTLANNGKILTGNWTTYYPAGNLGGRGQYNPAGEKDGQWVYYYFDGSIKAKEHFVNGKLQGEQLFYFENGNLSSREYDTNDKADGLATAYYYAGNVRSVTNYKQGKKDGAEKDYYSNGALLSETFYVNGQLSGADRGYYKSGQLKSTEQYVGDKAEGPYKSYHENGVLASEGQLSKDKNTGEWKFYYPSGKIKDKHSFVNDEEEGPHAEYFENGRVSYACTAKKGKIDGEANYFYEDGKPLEKYIYQNGIIKSAKFIDTLGHETNITTARDSGVELSAHSMNGFRRSHGFFDAKGELSGPDTLFYPSGKIEEINTYKDGELNGSSISWYRNGVKKSEVNMTDGKEDGYLTTWYPNGKLEAEGWMKNGEYHGEWLFYDEPGRLTGKSNYLDGDLDGYKETYNPDGRITTEEKYHRGWLEKLVQFDSLRSVIHVDSFPKASGVYTLIYPGGKVMTRASYINGDFEGPYQTFYFDGSVEDSYNYKKGMLDSIYTSYYYGGKKSEEGMYSHGNRTGTWKYYNEDGIIDMTSQYRDDELNGERTYYFENGVKNYVAEYKDGESDGTDKRFELDGSVAYQVTFRDGKAVAYTYFGKDGRLVSPISLLPGDRTVKALFPNGKVARECQYSDGVKTGLDLVYFNNGQLRFSDSTSYGISTGVEKEFYPDGKPRSLYHYLNDNYNGICTDYNENGLAKKEAAYDNGVLQGPTKYYNKNGKPTKIYWYYYGKLISVKNE